MAQILREYQIDAINRVRAAFAAGQRRVALIAPTGAGKTTIAAEFIRRSNDLGRTSLCIAHRIELIEQLSDRLTLHGVPHHGIIMAGVRPTEAPVQVASIQTLLRRPTPPADLILIDECAHCPSPSYQTAIKRLLDTRPNAYIIGLTATPVRLDGRGLGDVFQELVVIATPKQLLAEGFLAPIAGKAFRRLSDLDGVRTVRGDYDEKQLAAIYERPEILGDVVARWQEFAPGRRTIAFLPSIAASVALAERLRAVGVPAEHLDYRAPRAERRAILDRVRSGATIFLSNVALLGEGVDIPELSCCVVARPTRSLALFLQMVGRIARPAPGKDGAFLLDHGDCVARHGHPYDDRAWTLSTSKPPKPKQPPLRTCPECFSILDGSPPSCPECGHVFQKRRKPLATNEEVLAVDIDAVRRDTSHLDDSRFARLLIKHRTIGNKPGAAIREFRGRGPSPIPWGVWYRYVKKGKGAGWR